MKEGPPTPKIGDLIGSGAFGDVFRGDCPLRGPVAIKQLRRVDTDGYAETEEKWAERKKRLLNEGRRLVDAEHPNVVRVHYPAPLPNGSDGVMLVMELCAGGSAESLYEAGPVPLDHAKKIATDIALGLECVHARGFLHRDIKPGNILLVDGGHAKLGDFGLATDDLVHGFGTSGSYQYADHVAIEVRQGCGTSVQSDIWAFGMTLYRLVHGSGWYDLETPKARFLVEDGEYAKNLPWLPHIPKAWSRFIRRCMHDNAERRFGSAREMLDAIGQLPTEPLWQCAVEPEIVRWHRIQGSRRVEVTWKRGESGRTRRWSAVSLPVGKGRRRNLGGSRRYLDLRAFFS